MMPTPPAVEIGAWLAILFFVVAGWNQVEKFLEKRKEKPSTKDLALDVTDRYATKADLKDHAQADDNIHSQLFSSIKGAERGVEDRLNARLDKIAEDALTSRRSMHKDIESLKEGVSGVKSTVALNTEHLKELSKQQIDMPNQIVALLKNTGAIK